MNHFMDISYEKWEAGEVAKELLANDLKAQIEDKKRREFAQKAKEQAEEMRLDAKIKAE